MSNLSLYPSTDQSRRADVWVTSYGSPLQLGPLLILGEAETTDMLRNEVTDDSDGLSDYRKSVSHKKTRDAKQI